MTELRRLQELAGSSTFRELIDQALTLLAFVAKESSSGHKFLLEREGNMRELVLPIFPRRLRPSEFAALAVDSREKEASERLWDFNQKERLVGSRSGCGRSRRVSQLRGVAGIKANGREVGMVNFGHQPAFLQVVETPC